MLSKTSYTGYPAIKIEKLQLSIKTYTQKMGKLQQIRELQRINRARGTKPFFPSEGRYSKDVYRGKVVK